MTKNIIKNNKFKSVIIYSVSIFFNKSSLYILLPLYTRVLSLELYGKYELILTYFSFLLMIGLVGLDSAILRFYKINDNKYNKLIYKTIGSLFKFSILFYLISGIIIFILNNSFFNGSILILMLFVSRLSIEGGNKIYKNKLRMDNNFNQFLLLDFFTFFISISTSLLLIKILENKFLAIFLSISFRSILGFIKFYKNRMFHSPSKYFN